MKLEVARPLGLSLLAVGVFLVLVPLVNVGLGVLPLQPSAKEWRFGTWGLFLGAMTLPILGLGLIAAGGVLRDSRNAARFAMVISAALSILALVGLIDFLMSGFALKNSSTDLKLLELYDRELRRTSLIALLAVPSLAVVAVASKGLLKGLEPAKVEAQDKLMRASNRG